MIMGPFCLQGPKLSEERRFLNPWFLPSHTCRPAARPWTLQLVLSAAASLKPGIKRKVIVIIIRTRSRPTSSRCRLVQRVGHLVAAIARVVVAVVAAPAVAV